MREGAVTLLLIALVLCLLGCEQEVSNTLPASWPVSELTLPPLSKLVNNVTEPKDSGNPKRTRVWTAKFDYYKDFLTLTEHVEQCLRQLSYSEYWCEYPNSRNSRGSFRTYYSPDTLTKVQVGYAVSDGEYTMQYRYNFIITVSPRPDPELKHVSKASSSGITHHLEPLQKDNR